MSLLLKAKQLVLESLQCDRLEEAVKLAQAVLKVDPQWRQGKVLLMILSKGRPDSQGNKEQDEEQEEEEEESEEQEEEEEEESEEEESEEEAEEKRN